MQLPLWNVPSELTVPEIPKPKTLHPRYTHSFISVGRDTPINSNQKQYRIPQNLRADFSRHFSELQREGKLDCSLVKIRADEHVAYGIVAQILLEMREIGFRRVSLGFRAEPDSSIVQLFVPLDIGLER